MDLFLAYFGVLYFWIDGFFYLFLWRHYRMNDERTQGYRAFRRCRGIPCWP